MPKLTPEQRTSAEKLLNELQGLQTALWDTALELEGLLDIEIDTTTDLEGMSVDDLIETFTDGTDA